MQQAIGCLHQCPSCGKYCDKEDGHGGKCQITTGHQICSMGGKVWRNKEEDMAAVLIPLYSIFKLRIFSQTSNCHPKLHNVPQLQQQQFPLSLFSLCDL